MKKTIYTAAITLSLGAIVSTPAAAHPENDIKPAGQCDKISPAQWRNVRKGMSLEAIEHVVGCRASHHSTNEFRTFSTDNYFFKTGSSALAEIKIRDSKLWQKYGYHSGL